MELSDDGARSLSHFEGLRLVKYKDSAGVWTIGIGHALTPSELASGIYDKGITVEQAYAICRQDTAVAMHAVASGLGIVGIPTHRQDVAGIFTFNVGTGAWLKSDVLEAIRAYHFDEVPGHLREYIHVTDRVTGEKRVDRGLVVRREAEIAIWVNGYGHPDVGKALQEAAAYYAQFQFTELDLVPCHPAIENDDGPTTEKNS